MEERLWIHEALGLGKAFVVVFGILKTWKLTLCVFVSAGDGAVSVHRLAPDRLLRVAEGLEVVARKQVEAGPAVPQPYVPPQRRQLRTREKLLRIPP